MYQFSNQSKIQLIYAYQSKLKYQKSLYHQASATPGADQFPSQLSSLPQSLGQFGP